LEANVKGILTLKSELHFGKYKGKTVEEVALIDVGYLCWLRREEANLGFNQFDANTNELLDGAIRDIPHIHRKFKLDIGKWKELEANNSRQYLRDMKPEPTVRFAEPAATPRPEGWGAW
jgi:hypothetical protein